MVMSNFLFDYPIQPFEQRAIVRQHLEDNKRLLAVGIKGNKGQSEANEILKREFDCLVESTRGSIRAIEASRVQTAYPDDLLDDISVELDGINRSVDEGLTRVDKTLVGGFAVTNAVLGVGFSALYEALNEVDQTLEGGFQDVRETIDEGFGEISSLLDELAGEFSDIKVSVDSGFEKLGALFDWGFSDLITQAELQNKSLKHIIKILLKPVTTEAHDLLSHAMRKYQNKFIKEALESFLFLLDEKKYRVVFDTYFPIYRFIGDIYLFEMQEYDKASEYYNLAVKYAPRDAKNLRSLLFLHIGYCYYYRQEFVKAIESVEESINANYSNEARYQLAQYCALSGKKDEAMVHLMSVLDSDKKYIFRVLQEPDFVSIKEEIKQFLIWLKRIRDLRSLKLQIVEMEKRVSHEIERNKLLNMDSTTLDKKLVALSKAIKIIEELDKKS